ncbi:hypothetical protein ADK53_19100 [Streptomyces sp. WM6373]|nr:hypothetical protein ADK53_19100 [Streptomyces sp. WM6373]
MTARPATDIRGQPGTPQRNGPVPDFRDGRPAMRGRSPGRPKSLRAPARWRLRAPWAGHKPPPIATRS